MSNKDFKTFLEDAANVVPSKRQLEWYKTEFYAFIHFSPNTYTGLEWGDGTEDPAIFNPVKFNPDQWVEAVKSAGMKGLVLTAKHHDGFCLWPSKYTEHCIKNSPYKDGKGDIVAETAEACKRGGIKFGFYLSPWDRNSKYYGTDEYNTYYKNQLTELLTNYGEIFHVWFDGACGEGPNGKKQVYDFKGYIDLIRKYQPQATVFGGGDVRWCGNESGHSRQSEWAVVPCEIASLAEKQTSGPLVDDDSFSFSCISCMDDDIGSLSNIVHSKGLCFSGAEVDMSIRNGWFYHPEEEPHSLDRLFDTYLRTVGGNCCFHLNIPPTPDGLFDDRDVKRLKELGDKISKTFSEDLAEKAEIKNTGRLSGVQCEIEIDFGGKTEFEYIVLSEDIAKGQRVESFRITKKNNFGEWGDVIYEGTTIGYKKICKLCGKCEADSLRILICLARGEVHLNRPKVY